MAESFETLISMLTIRALMSMMNSLFFAIVGADQQQVKDVSKQKME